MLKNEYKGKIKTKGMKYDFITVLIKTKIEFQGYKDRSHIFLVVNFEVP